MSIFETCVIDVASPAIMESAGRSLASTLYDKGLTITLSGELGAGKTTFARGFAKGLGIEEKVVSPTYALEQRYLETLSHIDLYRLNEGQAKEFLSHIEEFSGIRLIEWIERLPGNLLQEKIAITIAEKCAYPNTSADTRGKWPTCVRPWRKI